MSLIVKEPERKKPTPWAKYTWVKESEDNFILRVESDFLARIYKDEKLGLWKTAIRLKDRIDRANHSDLETAAKFADTLLYKIVPKVWTVTDARIIIAPWKGDLTFEEAT
jgi:hypothetical protein